MSKSETSYNKQLINIPKPKARLLISKNFVVESDSYPNWWYRLWYSILLGWKWEKTNG